MVDITTGTGYFSLVDRLEKLRSELTFGEFLWRHREALESIADITRLDSLWADPYWMKGHPLLLRLKYTGTATSRKEASADLARIMIALRCGALDLRIVHCAGRPEAEYKGTCWLGHTKLQLRLRVLWLPAGCHVRIASERRAWKTERSYSVSCKRS